ncbi:hypothetical protein JCM10213_004222 [Rhodosporidiobolus nylandii]
MPIATRTSSPSVPSAAPNTPTRTSKRAQGFQTPPPFRTRSRSGKGSPSPPPVLPQSPLGKATRISSATARFRVQLAAVRDRCLPGVDESDEDSLASDEDEDVDFAQIPSPGVLRIKRSLLDDSLDDDEGAQAPSSKKRRVGVLGEAEEQDEEEVHKAAYILSGLRTPSPSPPPACPFSPPSTPTSLPSTPTSRSLMAPATPPSFSDNDSVSPSSDASTSHSYGLRSRRRRIARLPAP